MFLKCCSQICKFSPGDGRLNIFPL